MKSEWKMPQWCYSWQALSQGKWKWKGSSVIPIRAIACVIFIFQLSFQSVPCVSGTHEKRTIVWSRIAWIIEMFVNAMRYTRLSKSTYIHQQVGNIPNSWGRKSKRFFTGRVHHDHAYVKYTKEFFTRENIPPIALIIGSVALCFQVGVLYPWHDVISKEFIELQVEVFFSFINFI